VVAPKRRTQHDIAEGLEALADPLLKVFGRDRPKRARRAGATRGCGCGDRASTAASIRGALSLSGLMSMRRRDGNRAATRRVFRRYLCHLTLGEVAPEPVVLRDQSASIHSVGVRLMHFTQTK
jgi:hypothetical protein